MDGRLKLPEDYKDFVMNYSGGIPEEKFFRCNKRNDESGDFYPVTYKVADTFKEFIALLNNDQ